MPKTITVLGAVAALALASQDAQAFSPSSSIIRPTTISSNSAIFSEEPKSEAAVFVPDEPATEEGDAASAEEAEIPLEAAEMLGRGAAKVRLEVWQSHIDGLTEICPMSVPIDLIPFLAVD